MTTRSIVFVTKHLPDANGAGSSQRAWNHLAALRSLGSVTLVLLKRDSLRESTEPRLPEDVEILRVSFHKPIIERSSVPGLTLLKHAALSETPRAVALDKSETSSLDLLLGAKQYDLALYFRCDCYQIIGRYLRARRVLVDFDDIESKVIAQENALNAARMGREFRLIGRLRARRQAALEDRILREADEVLVCSEYDAIELRRRSSSAAVGVVANGLTKALEPLRDGGRKDLAPGPDATDDNPERSFANILFVGTLSYAPNDDALCFFLEEIFPILERLDASIRLRCNIVGPGASEQQLALGRAEVSFLGRVEALEPYYRSADLAVVPIRFGGGTRIKIIEAFSFGVPVVATTIGAEGLGVTDGRELLLADDPRRFAEACARLLTDRRLASTIARQAHEFVAEKYAAPAVQKMLRERILGD